MEKVYIATSYTIPPMTDSAEALSEAMKSKEDWRAYFKSWDAIIQRYTTHIGFTIVQECNEEENIPGVLHKKKNGEIGYRNQDRVIKVVPANLF